jgi:hypothetical protein
MKTWTSHSSVFFVLLKGLLYHASGFKAMLTPMLLLKPPEDCTPHFAAMLHQSVEYIELLYSSCTLLLPC